MFKVTKFHPSFHIVSPSPLLFSFFFVFSSATTIRGTMYMHSFVSLFLLFLLSISFFLAHFFFMFFYFFLLDFFLSFQRNIYYLFSSLFLCVPFQSSLFFSFPHLSFPHLSFPHFSDLQFHKSFVFSKTSVKSYSFFLPLFFPFEADLSFIFSLIDIISLFSPFIIFYSFSILIFSFSVFLEDNSLKAFILGDGDFPFPDKPKENLEKALEKIKETGSNINIYLLAGFCLALFLGGYYLFQQIDPYLTQLIEITRKVSYVHSHVLSLIKDINSLSGQLNDASFSLILKEHNSENDLLYSLLKDLKNKLSEYNNFSSINQYYINLYLKFRSLEIPFHDKKIVLKDIHDYTIYSHKISSYFSHDFEIFYKIRNP